MALFPVAPGPRNLLRTPSSCVPHHEGRANLSHQCYPRPGGNLPLPVVSSRYVMYLGVEVLLIYWGTPALALLPHNPRLVPHPRLRNAEVLAFQPTTPTCGTSRSALSRLGLGNGPGHDRPLVRLATAAAFSLLDLPASTSLP